jgi:hypothetical protein
LKLTHLTAAPSSRIATLVALWLLMAFSLSAQALDIGAANRRAPLPGLYDWRHAGYNEGGDLPTDANVTATIYAVNFGVTANDDADDTAALQAAIDSGSGTGLNGLRKLVLPAGTINISRSIAVRSSYLWIVGAGSDPATGTKIVFRPDADTRYDILTADGSQPDMNAMASGSGQMGWVWPGRGLFKVQVTDVHPAYASEYAAAPANRRDIFEGSVNFHWKAGVKVKQTAAYAALKGATVIPLDSSADMSRFSVGGYVQIGAANTRKMFTDEMGADCVASPDECTNGFMKSQVFKLSAVDTAGKTITLDKPLEFDLNRDSVADGSAQMPADAGGSPALYYSKAVPLKMVRGVGFSNFTTELPLTGLPKLGGGAHTATAADAIHNYGNIAPEYAMHGIIFKWAADSFVRNVKLSMTGSHPIVTEFAKNIQVQDNQVDGAWNKGKGGNGYLRGSKVWDSLYTGNTLRNVRHFTFQWGASGNVAIANDFDCDMNLHGGWERYNLFEMNTVKVPFNHSSGSCTANCGGEGGGTDAGTWYPIYWSTGRKAHWAGATGPKNIFYNNLMKKEKDANGDHVGDGFGGTDSDFLPYYRTDGSKQHTIFQFGTDSANEANYKHLETSPGVKLADWGGSETLDWAVSPRNGVNSSRTDGASASLFLVNVDTLPCTGPATPSGLTATPGNAQVNTSWNAVSGAASYTLSWKSDTASAWAAATGITGTSALRTGLANGTLYDFKVAAVNSCGTSADSAVVKATPTGGGGTGGSFEVKAELNRDDSKQTKYNVSVKNTGSVAAAGLTARIYVDVSELLAANHSASSVVCDVRSGTSSSFTCSALKPYSGNVYYAELNFGSYSLAAGATLNHNITLRLSDWALIWNSGNDYSRTGLNTSSPTVTTRIPVYQGGTLASGSNP